MHRKLLLAVLLMSGVVAAQQVWVATNTFYLSSPDLGTNNWFAGGGQNPETPGLVVDESPKLWASIYVNAVTVAGTIYGGEVLPTGSPAYPDLNITGLRFRIDTPGAGGNTPLNFRVSDGTNDCDCSDGLACDSAAGNYRLNCTGVCIFAEGVELTYTVESIGDCATGPLILGNIQVEGRYGP